MEGSVLEQKINLSLFEHKQLTFSGFQVAAVKQNKNNNKEQLLQYTT